MAGFSSEIVSSSLRKGVSIANPRAAAGADPARSALLRAGNSFSPFWQPPKLWGGHPGLGRPAHTPAPHHSHHVRSQALRALPIPGLWFITAAAPSVCS